MVIQISNVTVIGKWSDGKFYRGRIRKLLRSGRFRIEFDDGDEASVELKDIYIASSVLSEVTRKLERCEAALKKHHLQEVGWKRERSQIAMERARIRREREEIQATASGEIITALRKALLERESKIDALQKLLASNRPSIQNSSVVYAGQR